MQVYGKLVIDFSIFVNTESPEEAIKHVIEQLNNYNIDLAKLPLILKKLNVHDANVEYEDVISE